MKQEILQPLHYENSSILILKTGDNGENSSWNLKRD